jgi:hypothetical protein
MKKLTIGIVALFSLLATNVLAAPTVTFKNQVPAPSYKSGLGFGLAGYTSSTKVETTTVKC